jgi:hypothetical protein
MDGDMKWFIALVASFFIVPMIGIGISEWHKQECHIELAKIGKPVEEIKELCK